MSEIFARLEKSRKDLLDLGFRNSLINYRARAKRLDIVDEFSTEVFRILVNDNRSMSFLPIPEPLNEKEEDALIEQLSDKDPDWENFFAEPEENGNGAANARHVDTKLQTKIRKNKLHATLLSIHNNSRTFIEEQGVNILYLACGFLEWYEADHSEVTRKAPLILIPVELDRGSVGDRFKITYTGEDIGSNLSLSEKLKLEFGLTLPEIADSEELNINEYLKSVEQAISAKPKWSVNENDIVLGFFSFGKFLMFKDLESDRWPDDSKPENHPIIAKILGDGLREPSSEFSEESNIDEVLAPEQMCQVMDADSSQTIAIMEVKNGKNLVIQGPPGTGKSQTITNIISEAVKENKTVLFVSEKMAALEVVKRRLDNIGIGDAALELHSHKSNKKTLLAELDRTLNLGKPMLGNVQDDIQALKKMRDRLNEYCEAVNKPILKSGLTPVKTLGLYLLLGEKAALIPRIDFSAMNDWSMATYKEKRFGVEELQLLIGSMGPVYEHPFFGAKKTVLLPPDQVSLRQQIEECLTILNDLINQSSTLASIIHVDHPKSRTDINVIIHAAKRASHAPHQLREVKISTRDWQARREDIDELINAGRNLNSLHQEYDDILIPDAWGQDVLDLRQEYVSYGNKWWKFLVSGYRNAKKRLTGLCRNPLPRETVSCLKIIDAILEANQSRQTFKKHEALGEVLFGAQWEKEKSNWDVLSKISEWIIDLYREIGEGEIPDGIISFLEGSLSLDDLSTNVERLSRCLENYQNKLQYVLKQLEFPEEEFSKNYESLKNQQNILDKWLSNFDELTSLISFNVLSEKLKEQGLADVVKYAMTTEYDQAGLLLSFDATWYMGLLENAYQEREPLIQFSRIGHDHIIDKFKELDRLVFEHNRARLALHHWKKLPSLAGAGELAIIKREINKKRKILPIRALMNQAGRAVQAIKPVFMMSPMSIANFLAPGGVKFDLIIFDEASQVKPIDAFGAILRGNQAVVVGDNKQLPPTSFFDSILGGDEDEEESETADLESILGLFLAKGASERMLRWHYRSRHESLIATSNYEFYDNKLVVFPSPEETRKAKGLHFRHLPETAYDRGKTRTNPKEAQAVAEAVMKHALSRPDLTLGVVAFSTAQRDSIQFHLELLRRRDSSVEDYFASHHHEPFFVKNLENVQGDERDVILISVGYGKTADGYMSMNFGPLTKEGGERRLNVLITRARQACKVFSNFSADDIDLTRTQSRGVRSLKVFLQYAKDGILERIDEGIDETDSPFEDAVIRELTSLGYTLRPQVGCAGFRIDIGVVDSEYPGRYILGIECDGATYHSSRSARDRDRLRQEVLENLGWKIHRIWSTDWFKNPKKELETVVKSIEKAKTSFDNQKEQKHIVKAVTQNNKPARSVKRSKENGQLSKKSTKTYYQKKELTIMLGDVDLHQVSTKILAGYIEEVVSLESPVHIEEVSRRIIEAVGIKRIGNRIKSAIQKAAMSGDKAGQFKFRQPFLWLNEMDKPPVRDRSKLASSSKKTEYIAPEEIGEALKNIVGNSFTISRDVAIKQVLNRFGLKRATKQATEPIEKAINEYVQKGALLENEGILQLASQGN